MNNLSTVTNIRVDDLSSMVARKNMVTKAMILPFVDGVETISDILSLSYQPGIKLITAGAVTTDITQAAHRAEIDLVERLGSSPFASEYRATLKGIMSARDLVYVANPNRVTGAHFSLSELEGLARAVPRGMLLIDEHYHDFFGITGASLLDILTNVIVIRSFTAPFSIASSDSGYLMAHSTTIASLAAALGPQRFTLTQRKLVLASLTNEEATSNRLKEVHDESLRVTTALGRLRIPSRICATDFLLIQVGDPASAGNHLAAEKIRVDNLDGYPQMRGYLRYRLQSPLSNDRLVRAFKTMPPEHLYPSRPDRSATRLIQGAARPPEATLTKSLAEEDWLTRLQRVSITREKTEMP
ncbi:MAG: aminotransferase class I/II-fold pyridoxal phosphate-dependent enzyme [bacterium]